MIDELYDDVLSVMKEHGFVDWFYNNHRGKVSPLKWCYDTGGTLKQPKTPPKNITWIVFSHDELFFLPYKQCINNEGIIGPF
jgi:hypothetical protein